MAVVGVLIGLVGPPLVNRLTAAERPLSVTGPPAGVNAAQAAVTPPAKPGTSPSASPKPPLLRMPGPVPQSGKNTFRYGTGVGKVAGQAGCCGATGSPPRTAPVRT